MTFASHLLLHVVTDGESKPWGRSELGLLDQDLQYKNGLSTKDKVHLKEIVTMVLCRKISQLTKVT